MADRVASGRLPSAGLPSPTVAFSVPFCAVSGLRGDAWALAEGTEGDSGAGAGEGGAGVLALVGACTSADVAAEASAGAVEAGAGDCVSMRASV